MINCKAYLKMEKTINLNRCGLFSYNYIIIMIYKNNLMWLVHIDIHEIVVIHKFIVIYIIY